MPIQLNAPPVARPVQAITTPLDAPTTATILAAIEAVVSAPTGSVILGFRSSINQADGTSNLVLITQPSAPVTTQ